jgi:hypothetical protein
MPHPMYFSASFVVLPENVEGHFKYSSRPCHFNLDHRCRLNLDFNEQALARYEHRIASQYSLESAKSKSFK